MHLKIITHEKIVFDGDVDEIYSTGIDGSFTILKDHIPYVTPLDIGITKVKIGNEFKIFTTMGGLFQYKDDSAVILTDTSECEEEIDESRAKMALERAKQRLADEGAKIDSKRAQAAVARAMARLKAKLNNGK